MAKETNWGLPLVLLIIGLIAGGLFTYEVFPKTVTETVKETVEVPVEVVKEVEVIKEVPTEIEVEVERDYLHEALDDFLAELEDKDKWQECGGDRYDFAQIEVSRLYDVWDLRVDGEDYWVDFRVRLKYLDTDTEDKCYKTFYPTVYYEEDEDPVVVTVKKIDTL